MKWHYGLLLGFIFLDNVDCFAANTFMSKRKQVIKKRWNKQPLQSEQFAQQRKYRDSKLTDFRFYKK